MSGTRTPEGELEWNWSVYTIDYTPLHCTDFAC